MTKSTTRPTRSRKNRPGVIRPAEMYRADEVMARMGWAESAFDSARKQGLKTFRKGKRVYVRGHDVIAYVTEEVTT